MVELELAVNEVVLQPDNAIIRRTGQIDLKSGLNTIDISNLDPKLDPNTVKLILSGEDLVIHNMKFATQTIEKKQEIEELMKLQKQNQAEIVELKKKLGDIEFLYSIFNELQNSLSEKFATGYARAKVALDAYTDFNNYLENEISRYLKEKEKVTTQINNLEDKNSEIKKGLSKISEDEQKEKKGHVTLNVESPSDQSGEVQLEYLLPAGRWNMFYELELHQGEMSLTKWVTITNSSEEPWNDVSLTLTDKIRSEISILPPKLVYMDPEAGIESDFLIPVQSILLPTRVSIANDSKPYKYEIGQEEIKSSRYIYYWNASNFADVVEILVISPLNNYLYPAPINIFSEGVFLDTLSHMEFISPGEEIGVPLRKVKTIQTAKRALNKDIKQIGVFKKQTQVNYDYVLSIKNHFGNPLKIIVYDRIPQPVDDKGSTLNVNYKEVSKLPHKVFDNGFVRWDLEVAPGETQEIDFKIRLIKGSEE